jgi:endonuclease/exonuclease/phosphatase family metal-dependent hydrolase
MRLRSFAALAGALLLAEAPAAQDLAPVGTPGTLDVATWNVKFFGRVGQGPSDEAKQFRNVLTVLRRGGVDVWGLQEVTDVATFNRLLDSLAGSGYAGILGPQVNQEPDFDQRLAFVYNPAAVALQSSGTILSGSNFGGRAPLELRGTVVLGDTSVAVRFIVIHAKAGATQSDYNQRANASTALKGYIDPLIAAGEHVVLLGDFNDELADSIVNGTQPSPYIGLTTDPDYRFVTLPLDQSNTPTYCGNNTACGPGVGSTLDHIVLTGPLLDDYDGASDRYAAVLDAFDAFGGEFVSTTSDHLPIWARLDLAGSATPAEPGAPRRTLALAPPAPNPTGATATLAYTLDRPATVRLEVFDALGRRVALLAEGAHPTGAHRATLDATTLPPGLYLVRLSAAGEAVTQRLARR